MRRALMRYIGMGYECTASRHNRDMGWRVEQGHCATLESHHAQIIPIIQSDEPEQRAGLACADAMFFTEVESIADQDRIANQYTTERGLIRP